MEVTIKEDNGRKEVILNGRLDTTNAEQFSKDIESLMTGENPDIYINCEGMEYTSSQGLRMFLMLQKSVSSRGGKMVMAQMRPQVKEVFDITGFSNIIKII